MKNRDVIKDFEEHLGDIILNDKKDVKRTKITSVIAFTLVILILSLLIGGVMFLKEIFSPGKELYWYNRIYRWKIHCGGVSY